MQNITNLVNLIPDLTDLISKTNLNQYQAHRKNVSTFNQKVQKVEHDKFQYYSKYACAKFIIIHLSITYTHLPLIQYYMRSKQIAIVTLNSMK